ncbi:MAG: hypothetical protein WCV99_15280 [Sterolibacterium sp.]|jgi:hypothetical protein
MDSGEVHAIAIRKHERNRLDSTQIIRNDFEDRTRVGFVQCQLGEQIGSQAGVSDKFESFIHPQGTVADQFNLLSPHPVGADQSVTYADPSQSDRLEDSLKQHSEFLNYRSWRKATCAPIA